MLLKRFMQDAVILLCVPSFLRQTSLSNNEFPCGPLHTLIINYISFVMKHYLYVVVAMSKHELCGRYVHLLKIAFRHAPIYTGI